MKEKTPTIKQIDKTVFEAGQRNGLNIKDTKFCGSLIEGKSQSEAYRLNIADKNTTPETIRVKASLKTRKDKIQKTIKEVLTTNKITRDSVVKTHNLILNKAIDINQLSVAEKANTKFMQLLGMEEIQPQNQTNIQINIEKMTKEDIDNKLKDIITV